MSRETKITGKIIHELTYVHKCFVINIAGNQFQKQGLPDFLILKDGIHIWVECKMEDEDIRPLQNAIHQQIKKNGVNVHILRFMGDKFWLLDGVFHINFKSFKEGVKLLLDVLTELEKKGVVRM